MKTCKISMIHAHYPKNHNITLWRCIAISYYIHTQMSVIFTKSCTYEAIRMIIPCNVSCYCQTYQLKKKGCSFFTLISAIYILCPCHNTVYYCSARQVNRSNWWSIFLKKKLLCTTEIMPSHDISKNPAYLASYYY